MIEDEIRKIILESVRPVDCSITENTDLTEIGLDSLSFAKVIVSVEDKFKIEFPDSKLVLSKANTVDKLSKIVTKEIKKKRGYSDVSDSDIN